MNNNIVFALFTSSLGWSTPCISALTEPSSPKVSILNCSFCSLQDVSGFPFLCVHVRRDTSSRCVGGRRQTFITSASLRGALLLFPGFFPSVWIIKIWLDDQTVSSWGYKVLLSWGWTVTTVVAVVAAVAVVPPDLIGCS